MIDFILTHENWALLQILLMRWFNNNCDLVCFGLWHIIESWVRNVVDLTSNRRRHHHKTRYSHIRSISQIPIHKREKPAASHFDSDSQVYLFSSSSLLSLLNLRFTFIHTYIYHDLGCWQTRRTINSFSLNLILTPLPSDSTGWLSNFVVIHFL